MSETIVFFGSGPVAAKSLDFLAGNFRIEAVVTKSKPPHHRGEAPVEQLAHNLNLPTYFANNKSDLDDLIQKCKFKSPLGIVVDYGVIISRESIDSFKMGIINSHFSLLPEWRGADPITFAILSGQEKTGVSLMLIEPALDTGKLLTRKSLIIKSDDNVQTLTHRLVELSNDLLAKFLPLYVKGDIKPRNQPHPNRATYSRKITKSDGVVDWSKPAIQIEREVRAYLGWPGSQTTIGNKRIIIKKAHTTKSAEDPLDIRCGDGRYLSIDELIAPSGRQMTANEFINGYRSLLT